MSDPTGQNPFGQRPGPQDGDGLLPPFQPPGPPGSGQAWQGAPPPKKKRWPWVLAGLFVFCFLPLGGCLAAVGFTFNELGNIEDEIAEVVDTMLVDASNENYAAGASFADNEGGCVTTAQLEEQLRELAPTGNIVISQTQFVERSDFTSLGNMPTEADDTFFVDGRTDAGAAEVTGTLEAPDGTRRFSVLLTGDLLGWEVCELTIS